MMKYNFESLFVCLNLLILIFSFSHFLSLSLFTVCLAGYNEKRLLHDLLDTYNTLERPVLNESDPLQLSFGLTLMQIIDVVSTIYIFFYTYLTKFITKHSKCFEILHNGLNNILCILNT